VNLFSVKKIEAWPVDLPLKASFVVASGAMDVARNIFVRVTLFPCGCPGVTGTVGYAISPDIQKTVGSHPVFPSASLWPGNRIA
jgi:hypothetical protein